jgi:hypothetical protein
MSVLSTVDFLADIQFVDYWDAEFLLKDTAVDSCLDTQFLVESFLSDIQFIDYWDAEFSLKDLDVDTASNDWEAAVSLDGWDADISFEN